MKNHLIAVAAAVPRLKVGDVSSNTKEIVSIIRENADCGVIVFPELSVTGYTCADLFQSDLLLRRAEEALLTIAEATADPASASNGASSTVGVTAVVGLPIRYENNIYNSNNNNNIFY